MKIYVWLRRCVQLLALFAFCLLPWVNALDMRQVSGSLFALDVMGVPFADPVAAAQVAAGGAMPGERLLAGALVSLALALLLGRVFCSWACPYGLFSEMARKITGWKKGNRPGQGQGFILKFVVLAAGLGAMCLWGYPVASMLSLPGELSLLPVLVWQGGGLWLLLGAVALPLAVLMLEMALGKRLWCRYVCPQSVFLGAAAQGLPRMAPGLRINWHAHKCSCKGNAPCQAACSLGLNPRRKGGPQRRDCTHCGDCLKVCAMHGQALAWRFGRDQRTETAAHPSEHSAEHGARLREKVS